MQEGEYPPSKPDKSHPLTVTIGTTQPGQRGV